MEGWWAASYVALWLVVIMLCVVVVALARQIGTLHLRVSPQGALELDDEGPPLGEMLEAHEAVDVTGRPAMLAAPGHDQLWLFVSPGCKVCEEVLPAVSVLASSQKLTPFILTDAERSETLRAYDPKKWGAPVISDLDVVRKYRIPGTPYVIIVDRNGVVRAKGTANTLEQMEGLVDTARSRMSAQSTAEHAL